MAKHAQALADHTRHMYAVVDRDAVAPVLAAYAEEQQAIVEELEQTSEDEGWSTVDTTIAVLVAAILLRGVRRMGIRLAVEMTASVRVTTWASLVGLNRFVTRVSGARSPLDNERWMRRILVAKDKALEELQRRSAAALARVVQERIHRRMLGAAAEGWTAEELIHRAGAAFDMERWQVARVIRTEAANAYNAAQTEGIHALSGLFPGMMKRWTELVDDTTGKPFDKRVAADSLALHGQVAPPNGMFAMPTDRPGTTRQMGRTWPHPPNRPNDRAVVTPWHPGWGIPGWIWDGSQRISRR